MASRFTRPRKVKAHAEQPGPRGPVGSYCIGPETRKAKGAATLVGYQISYVKGRVRRAVVSTIYLNRVRYRGRMTLTDTDRTQDVTHSQPQAGPHPRDTRRDPGSGSTDARARTHTRSVVVRPRARGRFAAIPTAYSNVARALKDLYITDNIVIRIRWVRPAAPLWHCRGSLTETKALVAPLEPSAFTAADINPYAPIQSPPRTPPFTGA